MEGVTGMMARLGHVPGCSRGGLYGPANIDFRFVMQLRLQRAGSRHTPTTVWRGVGGPDVARVVARTRTVRSSVTPSARTTAGLCSDCS